MIDRRSLIGGCATALAGVGLLPAKLLATAPPVPESAWRHLFNGRSLDGWTIWQEGSGNRDLHKAIAVENGELHFLGPRFDGPDKASFGHLATKDVFGDYHLQVQFRWGQRRFAPRDLQRRNSGLLYHLAPDLDRLFPDGVEFQVEETDVGDAVMINTRALQGPLLGGTPLWPNWFPGLPSAYQEPILAGGIARQWLRHSGQF